MWTRHDARPTPYKGINFRSALEASVAADFDRLGVNWSYEVPVEGVNYLPDFTINEAPADLCLPRWVEVKPAELLYAVRDHFGLGERFEDDEWFDCSADDLQSAGIEEIWKPKRLVEHTGGEVLVVSKIARNRTLSVEMHPGGVVLSRLHPCVNWRQITHDREAAQRQRDREAEWARERRSRELAEAEWRSQVLLAVKDRGRPARYGGWCVLCGAHLEPEHLMIVRVEETWRPVCRSHVK